MEAESLTITFPPELGGAAKTFQNPKDLKRWVNQERASFSDFGTGQNSGYLWRDTGGKGKGWSTMSTLSELEGHSNDWERELGTPPDHPRRAIHNAKRAAEAYLGGYALASDSAPMHAIREYRDSGADSEAVLGYGCAILEQPLLDYKRHIVGFIHGTIAVTKTLPFMTGDRERISHAAQESERLQGEIEKLLAEQSSRNDELRKQWTDLIDDTGERAEKELVHRQTETADFASSHEGLISQLSGVTAEALKKSDDDITQFKARLKTEIALGFPIDHWEKKAKHHNAFFWGSLVAFVLFAGLFVIGIHAEGSALMEQIRNLQDTAVKEVAPVYGPLLPGAEATPAVQPSSGIPLHFLRLGILALSITLGIWFLRFVARILLSSLHLRDDASERVVMIKTFLAFNEAKVGLSPEDVKLALASVFRPATSGLVSDDGIPPGIWDAITRLKQ